MDDNRLPEIGLASSQHLNDRGQVLLSRISNRNDFKSREGKKIYLARRIPIEELQESISKQVNASHLSRIKEEKVEAFDEEVSEINLGSEFNLTMKESKNFFQTKMLVSPKYKETDKGPAYRDGRVVKHSIIGSVEMYEHQQKQLRSRHLRGSIRGSILNSEENSMSDSIMSRPAKRLSSTIINDGTTGQTRLATAVSVLHRKPSKEKRKILEQLKVTKNEFLDRLDELKSAEGHFDQLGKFGSTPVLLGDKLVQTKEERCLDQFEKTSSTWEKSILNITKIAGKRPENSVMLRSDIFRNKKEVADLLETTKTEAEKYGVNAWHLSLRDGLKPTTRNYIVKADLPAAFNTMSMTGSSREFQMIRRCPALYKTLDMTQSLSPTRNLDRSKEDYVKAKYERFGKVLKKIDPTETKQVESLLIQGQSKLDMEATAFMQEHSKTDIYSVPKTFMKDKAHEKVHEIIERHADQAEFIKTATNWATLV